MKVTLAKNGWTPIVSDIDLTKATPEEINIIGCLAGLQTLVIIKNQQHMSTDDDIAFIKKVGNPDINADYVKNVVIDGTERILRRVTGKKNKDNRWSGLFGHKEELGWHANPVEDPNRKPLVYLRAIEGTEGSVTSFTNHVRAWQKSLAPELKKFLEETTLHTVHGHDHTYTYHKQTFEDLYGTSVRKNMYSVDQLPPFVYTNKFGTTGFFLSWSQLEKFYELGVDESKKIAAEIRRSVLNDQDNIYDHHWDDGDVLLSDQWLGLHKRHAFEGMESRLLHRAVVDYSFIDPAKKEKAAELIKNAL